MSNKPTPAISLADARMQPPEGMVEYVEDLLEDVKSGQIRGLCLSVVYQGRSLSHGLVQGDAGWSDLYTSTARLQHALLNCMDRHEEDQG